MLDTVVLSLEQHEFRIREPGRFSPSAQGLLAPPYYPLGGRGNFSCVQNPTKADLLAGRYRPRLTLNKRVRQGGFSLTLRIEFSVPKLIFGNNFDELTSRDFEAVLQALGRGLDGMGVVVGDETLRAARVSAIHYSKNIALLDFTSCAMVMNELGAIDLDRRLDLSHTDYRDGGHAIRYHANSFEVTFYDKLKDLQKARRSEKRALEDDNAVQLGLIDRMSEFPKQLEVLRMEVRLGNRKKIVNVLKRAGADPQTQPIFAALFDASLARRVLLHFWEGIHAELLAKPASKPRRAEELLHAVVVNAGCQTRPSRLLQEVGYLALVESVGVRAVSALLARHGSRRSWQRYKRGLVGHPATDAVTFRAARYVTDALREFRPLRLASFQAETRPATMSAGTKQSGVAMARGDTAERGTRQPARPS